MRHSIISAGPSLLLAVGASVSQARAADTSPADPARIAAATRFLADSGGETRVEAVLHGMRGLLVNLIATRGKSMEDAGRIVDDVLMPALRSHLPELHDALVRYWAAAMTTSELDTVDRFFRTPTGRKLVDIQTRDVPLMLAIGQQWGRRAAADVLASQREALRRRGVAL